MRYIYPAAILMAFGLAGCGTTVVSPAIANKPGVKTAMGQDGYPILVSVHLTTPTKTTAESRSKCISSQLDDIEGAPIIVGSAVQASGKSSFYFARVGANEAFRYTVRVDGQSSSSYTFERLRYFGSGTQGGPIMASQYWSPEKLVEELETITDRIDACARTYG
ncbi:hypothetical protein PS914_05924 [Pseudomonas fluorescens]|uniref:hypothetical protein n=1 Tax=Pseudomonas fluorescens TaxID=294 RepID=UPI00123F3741|nr:hypothetical protein [Pseudomonas fluorescens]VVQ16888.1 hypothetical protein PS914_05924 [Pseudomonas fluorescens]